MIGLGAALAAATLIAADHGSPWKPGCAPKVEAASSGGVDAFVATTSGRLHLTQFGPAEGAPLLLLAGLNDNARIFDDLAPRLAGHRRVFALTRRGFGLSEPLAAEVTLDALVDDIVQAMDALCVARADVVGHSIAGGEMTRLAITHPYRVRRLVYLDAAYDRADVPRLAAADPIRSRAPPPQALLDMQSLAKWRGALLGVRPGLVAPNLAGAYAPDAEGLRPRTAASVAAAIAGADRVMAPRYDLVQAPALAIYAPRDRVEQPPVGLDAKTLAAAQGYARDVARPWMLGQKARFETQIGCGRAQELKGGHYFFLQRPARTARMIEGFLSAADPCA